MSQKEREPSKADAVEHAVALKYKDLEELPQVLASGSGSLAARIVQVAERFNIPIHQDSQTAERLSGLSAGQNIGEDCYELVAEIIAFLYHVDRNWREEHKFLSSVIKEG